MVDPADHREPPDPSPPLALPLRLSWLMGQRRTAALQLEALSPRGSRHRTERAVALRRRVRVLDDRIARARSPR